MYLTREGPSKRVRQRGSDEEGPPKMVSEDGPLDKIRRRRSTGEGLQEKTR